MANASNTLILAAVLLTGAHAQGAGTSQPTQAQQQPCGTASSSSKPKIKIPSKWQQKFDQISPVSSTDLSNAVAAKPAAPCPPNVVPPAPAPMTPQAAAVNLPPDSFVTLRCNPKIIDPKAIPLTPDLGGVSVAFAAMAIPKANEYEVDKVEIDDSVKTPCYRVKFDPNTGKQFVPQP